MLWVVDDNFLVDRERALGIAEGLVRREAKFDWSIQASTNLVDRFTVDELKLLKRSGLSQMAMGADSGSPKVMKLMGKDFQKIETIWAAAEKLHSVGNPAVVQHDLRVSGRGRKERIESIRLIMDICRRYPGAEFWTNIFTPYPGAPIMERAFELGIQVPKTFEEWSEFFPRYTGSSLDERQEARAAADHARIPADGVPARAGFDPSQGQIHQGGARAAGDPLALAARSRRVRIPLRNMAQSGRPARIQAAQTQGRRTTAFERAGYLLKCCSP